MLNWLGWLPENASTYGAEIDGIIAVVYYLALAWFSPAMSTSRRRSRQ